MKKTLFITQFFLASVVTAWATPLAEEHVAKEAKWLVHFDMEDLLYSQFGEFAMTHAQDIFDKEMESPVSINLRQLLKEMRSVTAYGTSFDDEAAENSVVVIKTGDKAQAIIDGYIASLEGEGHSSVEYMSRKRFPSYSIEDDLYFAFPEQDVLVLSKSYEKIEDTADLLEGKEENVSSSDMFKTLERGDGFFLVSILHRIADLKDFPPQARVLQKATAAAFYAGEDGTNVEAKIMLTTESKRVSEQLYRIVMGMLALVSFAEIENKSLSAITETMDIQKGDDFVSIHLNYPSEEIIELLNSLAKSIK
ncbi:hypothetical protein MLD52_08365 [Puniceicoccaceae bacterium K14]|nr:hypothetical protein [Puniceicoccaceae bacterium K14]